jgi:hypothetical protein
MGVPEREKGGKWVKPVGAVILLSDISLSCYELLSSNILFSP